MRWQPLNLASADYDVPSEPPNLCGLFYRGKRHLVSGPPEALKTLVCLWALLEHVRAGGVAAILDFESGPHETKRMFRDLGATLEEIGAVIYVEVEAAPDADDVQALIDAGVTFVLVDALAGAYSVSMLDENKRADVELFAGAWINPLWRAGITTVLVDHVTKNSETRGAFSIGSERKLGAVDVHVGLKVVAKLNRGGEGIIGVETHKDRPGWLSRPKAAEIKLVSDPETHALTVTFTEGASETDGGGKFRPTNLMQKVSAFLAWQDEPVSRNAIVKGVVGNTTYVREAIDRLVEEGYAAEAAGANRARLVSHVSSFTDLGSSSSSRFVPGSSGRSGVTGSSSSSPPIQGDEPTDEPTDELERLQAAHADLFGEAA